MKGIVINLDRRPERWREFQELNTDKLPFEIERFSAFDMKPGEDGCTYSHLAVLRSQTEYPFIVFEDDCIMLEDWSVVQRAIDEMPNCWDGLWLGANLTRPLRRWSRSAFYLHKAYCLHAVIYNTPRMVEFILKNHNTPKGKNLDIFYYNTVFSRFNCFITSPLCATQSEGYSDIAKTATGSWIIKDSYERFTVPTRRVQVIKLEPHRIHKPKLNEIHRRRIR